MLRFIMTPPLQCLQIKHTCLSVTYRQIFHQHQESFCVTFGIETITRLQCRG